MKQYVLTTQLLGRLKYHDKQREDLAQKNRKNPLLQCMLCRKDIVVGDVLVRRNSTKHSKRYHLECAKKVNLI